MHSSAAPILALSGEPWLGWLLVCLVRQQQRQSWLMKVHREQLAEVDEEEGEVPDLEAWSYEYHGRGLCLSGPGAEVLDVDFYDDEARTIDPYFFATRILSLEPPPAPEQELRAWLPNRQLIVSALETLHGSLLDSDQGHTFRLADSLQDPALVVETAEFEPEKMAAWRTALAPDSARAEAAFDDWLESLLSRERPPTCAVLLRMSETRRARVAEGLLQQPLGRQSADTVEALYEVGLDCVRAVEKFVEQLRPREHHPYLAWQICRYLLAHGVRRSDCIAVLQRFSEQRVVEGYKGNPFDYELATLVLEFDAARGVPLLRRALRSATPHCLESAAALLSLFDDEWSREELWSALEEVGEPTAQRRLLMALLQSSDRETRRLAAERMPRSRKRSPNEIGFTFDEVVEANLDSFFERALESASQDFARLSPEKIAQVAGVHKKATER